MNKSSCALAAFLVATAGAAECADTIAVYGRAGMPVGSERHAYIVDTARPPSFAALLRTDLGAGRAGGPATLALANARAADSGVARRDEDARTVAFGRAGYVPASLWPSLRASRPARVAGTPEAATAARTH